jgi:hypothetical protein
VGTTPSWLYYVFGILVLAVAAYCLASLVLSVSTRRTSGRDVDVAHTLMGVAMAGMFVSSWAFGPRAIWELIFAVLLVWFVTRSIQSILQYGAHVPHEAVHAAMSLAMLLMYWFPVGASSASMSMTASAGAPKLDPAVGFVLALVFFASAVFTLASPVKGASHHGTHVPAYAIAGSGEPGGSANIEDGDTSPISTIEVLIATPWLEDASHVVMCVAMGFMLVLML